MDDDWLHHQISDNWYNQLLENPKANKIYKNIRLNARINPGTSVKNHITEPTKLHKWCQL